MVKLKNITCPVCQGTKRVALTDMERAQWWNNGKTDQPCRNCGGQTQFGAASGFTFLREDGTPCVHEYRSENRGRCYTVYFCQHCPDSFDIDSSD
jgi:hypothetical protein